jgi:spore coat polysaccharide biosynthesis protein SpsF
MDYTFRRSMTTSVRSEPAPVQVFVQARMSSRRFPGKVLAPLDGRPLIRHVVEAVARALPAVPLVVATTSDESDDPLVAYLDGLGVTTFRGERDDVLGRFRACAAKFPAAWVLRVCADSPRLDPRVLRAVVDQAGSATADLVTTRLPVSLAKGQNAELIRTRTLLSLDPGGLTADDREHVTAFFYRAASRFRIGGVADAFPDLRQGSFVGDELDDLRRLARNA